VTFYIIKKIKISIFLQNNYSENHKLSENVTILTANYRDMQIIFECPVGY